MKRTMNAVKYSKRQELKTKEMRNICIRKLVLFRNCEIYKNHDIVPNDNIIRPK